MRNDAAVLVAVLVVFTRPLVAADSPAEASSWSQLTVVFAAATPEHQAMVIPPGDYAVPADARPILRRDAAG